MADPFLDTNVFLRHLLNDDANHSPRATAFLRRIEQGEVRVQTSDMVVFEIVFTLERTYRQPKAQIRDKVLALLDLPGIELSRKGLLHSTFDIYVNANISFADAYHAALLQEQGTTEVVSFDRDFDRVPWIERIEP